MNLPKVALIKLKEKKVSSFKAVLFQPVLFKAGAMNIPCLKVMKLIGRILNWSNIIVPHQMSLQDIFEQLQISELAKAFVGRAYLQYLYMLWDDSEELDQTVMVPGLI